MRYQPATITDIEGKDACRVPCFEHHVTLADNVLLLLFTILRGEKILHYYENIPVATMDSSV